MGRLIPGLVLIGLGWVLLVLSAVLHAGTAFMILFFFCEIVGSALATASALEKRG